MLGFFLVVVCLNNETIVVGSPREHAKNQVMHSLPMLSGACYLLQIFYIYM